MAKHPIATESLNGIGWYPARPVDVEVGALDVVEGEGEETNGTAAQVIPSFEGVTGHACVDHLGPCPFGDATHSASMLSIHALWPATKRQHKPWGTKRDCSPVQESVACMERYAMLNCWACCPAAADRVCVGVDALEVAGVEFALDAESVRVPLVVETLELFLVDVDAREVVAGTKTVTVMVTAPSSLVPCPATVAIGTRVVVVQSGSQSPRFSMVLRGAGWSSAGFASSGRAMAQTPVWDDG